MGDHLLDKQRFIHLSGIVSFVSSKNCLEEPSWKILRTMFYHLKEKKVLHQNRTTQTTRLEFEELDSNLTVQIMITVEKMQPGSYSSEPLSDDEWLREYYREREIIEENERQLQNQLDGVVEKKHMVSCLHSLPCRHGRLERSLLFVPAPPDFVFESCTTHTALRLA